MKFESRVLEIKHQVLTEVAKVHFDLKSKEYFQAYTKIPYKIMPGPRPTLRCCIFSERAIVTERINLALGGNPDIPNIVETIDYACDACPVGGYTITNICRGCVAHRCKEACPKNAIIITSESTATIDKTKCINCGLCAKACQFSAIINYKRPCVAACPVNAISMDDLGRVKIDDEKCIQCGNCMIQCPFGAITDKSYITDVIDMLKKEDPVVAIIAPAIGNQFPNTTYGQIVTGLLKLGFSDVYEAAYGAEMVIKNETEELLEHSKLTSSCCPSFVNYIEKFFPSLKQYISSNPSPMIQTGLLIKKQNPNCRVVFIGPCVSKKSEIQRKEVKGIIDSVLTFEELYAMLDSRNIDCSLLEDASKTDASYYGRIFARSGGLTEGIQNEVKSIDPNKEVSVAVCNGFEDCKVALLKLQKGVLQEDFIEGMICNGGCMNGPCSLNHDIRGYTNIQKYARSSSKKHEEIINTIEMEGKE